MPDLNAIIKTVYNLGHGEQLNENINKALIIGANNNGKKKHLYLSIKFSNNYK